jgi:predicted nucleotidyltransferase
MNRHFAEMLRALSDANVEYLVIGSAAVAAHGFVRSTKDIDIWIRPSRENVKRVWRALADFGAPLEQLTPADLEIPGTVFQIGIDPIRIDLLTAVEPLEFDGAWTRRATFSEHGIDIHYLGKADLIASKRAAGRSYDERDIEELEKFP